MGDVFREILQNGVEVVIAVVSALTGYFAKWLRDRFKAK